MDKVTLNIILALLFSLGVLLLFYLGIMLIVIPYWDKKMKKKIKRKTMKIVPLQLKILLQRDC